MFEIIAIQLNWVKCLRWKYVKHIENIKYNKKIKKNKSISFDNHSNNFHIRRYLHVSKLKKSFYMDSIIEVNHYLMNNRVVKWIWTFLCKLKH